MQWTEEAVETFTKLVEFLPDSLRAGVEEHAETIAERLAMQSGKDRVERAEVIGAISEAAPVHMKGRVTEGVECIFGMPGFRM